MQVELNTKKLKSIRKELRSNQTDQERLLWSKLRKKQLLDCKFFRQYSIENFIVDFCCPKLKIIIEIDGSQHAEDESSKKDMERDEYLNLLGYKVIRVWNSEISSNLEGVLSEIALVIEAKSNPS